MNEAEAIQNLVEILFVIAMIMGVFTATMLCVVIAEFIRRERTSTQADDWMNFGKKEDDS